jgi:O-antigen/teichoic acid export membrane protein
VFSGLFFIWIMFVRETNLWMIYFVYMVARVLSIVLGMALLDKKLAWPRLEKIDRGRLWGLFLLCVPMGLYHLVFVAYDRSVDTWILSYFWGKEIVASYGVAYKVYSSLVLPAYFFMNSVFPRLSSESEEKKKRRVVIQAAPWLIFMALGLIVVTMVLSPALMSFMIPGRPLEATGLLRILSFALIFSYANHLLGFFLLSKNGQKRLLSIGVLGLCLNIIFNYLTIPSMGASGAAWVTVGTEALMTLFLLGIFLRR